MNLNEMKEEVFNTAIQESQCDAEVYEDYSGRGMYGNTVVGITIEQGDQSKIIQHITQAATELYPEHVDRIVPRRSDNMGLQIILY